MTQNHGAVKLSCSDEWYCMNADGSHNLPATNIIDPDAVVQGMEIRHGRLTYEAMDYLSKL